MRPVQLSLSPDNLVHDPDNLVDHIDRYLWLTVPRRATQRPLQGERSIQPLRSFLFAPGNHPRRVQNALTLDADAVILDLEDAVAIAEKRAGRDAVVAALSQPRRALIYIRVNAIDTEFCYGDLAAIVRPGLDGVILPKAEAANGLATVDWLLAQLEREHALAPRSIDLIPIVETARGLIQIDSMLAAGTRVKRVAFGAGIAGRCARRAVSTRSCNA